MELLEAEITLEDINDFLGQIGEVSEEYDVTIQAIDASYVVGRDHLGQAVRLADRAFERGENIARERSVEILLYAAGTRQIDEALTLGVEPGTQPAVVVVHDPNGSGDETAALDAVASLSGVSTAQTIDTFERNKVQSWFEISDAELAATDATLSELVCERVALLTVEK
jgi:KEOPS complex subunit Cgi121